MILINPSSSVETMYRTVLDHLTSDAFKRLTIDVSANISDLEDKAIKGIEKFIKESDRANLKELRREYDKFFGDGAAKSKKSAAIGADVSTAKSRSASDNKELVRSIGEKMRDQIASIRADTASKKPIEERLDGVLSRAERRNQVIARDQNGKLNANLSEARNKAAGASAYYWITQGDDRVRQLHMGLNGRLYEYGQPTGAEGGGMPGTPIQCRCVASPAF